jgi:hypothetical protein
MSKINSFKLDRITNFSQKILILRKNNLIMQEKIFH